MPQCRRCRPVLSVVRSTLRATGRRLRSQILPDLQTELVVNDRVSFIGAALAGVWVRDSGALDMAGVIQDHLTIEAGGYVRLNGVCDGVLDVREGGFLEVVGVLDSPIPLDVGGAILVKAGSVLRGLRVTSNGELIEADRGDPESNITEDAPCFRIVRGGGRPELALQLQ